MRTAETRTSKTASEARLTIALCFAIAFMEGFDIQAIGVAAPSLGPELGLDPSSLGKALAASNVGLVLGAVGGGWLADRWGRKPVLIASVLIFGLFTLATTLATSYPVLFGVRMGAGLGFGAALPNLMAMAAEVAQPKRRGATATMMFCGMPLGGGTVALISALHPQQDWRALFLIGGLLPVLIVPALILLLRETRKAAVRPPWRAGLRRESIGYGLAAIPVFLGFNLVAQRLTGEADRGTGLLLTLDAAGLAFNPALGQLLRVAAPWLALVCMVVLIYVVVHRDVVFGGGRATTSVLLWLNFVPTLLILYLILNWLPTLVNGKGFPQGASWASVCFNYGSVAGALVFGRLVDRFGIRWPMLVAYGGLLVALVLLGGAASLPLILVMSGLVGFTLLGANYAMYGVAAAFYPSEMRGRGSGATVAWGRLGAVAAPLGGGLLLAGGASASGVLVAMATPAVIAGMAALLLSVFARPVAD